MKKVDFSKDNVKRILKNSIIVVIGTIVLAFGTGVFLVPFDLVTGGMTGLAISLVKIIPLEFMTVDIYVTILTWFLFLLGWIFLGSDFTFKTLISALVYPIALSLFMKLPSPDVLGGFFDLSGSESYSEIALIYTT